MAITPWAQHSLSMADRVDRMYNPHAANVVCNYKRRRQQGAGRPNKSRPFLDSFTRWFGSIRFSIDACLMCRVPIALLLAMVRRMCRQYLAITLKLGDEPKTDDVTPRWIKMWLVEMRLCSRSHNWKYTDKRSILAERLRIFGLVVHSWRYWVFLEYSYDPHFGNARQGGGLGIAVPPRPAADQGGTPCRSGRPRAGGTA